MVASPRQQQQWPPPPPRKNTFPPTPPPPPRRRSLAGEQMQGRCHPNNDGYKFEQQQQQQQKQQRQKKQQRQQRQPPRSPTQRPLSSPLSNALNDSLSTLGFHNSHEHFEEQFNISDGNSLLHDSLFDLVQRMQEEQRGEKFIGSLHAWHDELKARQQADAANSNDNDVQSTTNGSINSVGELMDSLQEIMSSSSDMDVRNLTTSRNHMDSILQILTNTNALLDRIDNTLNVLDAEEEHTNKEGIDDDEYSYNSMDVTTQHENTAKSISEEDYLLRRPPTAPPTLTKEHVSLINDRDYSVINDLSSKIGGTSHGGQAHCSSDFECNGKVNHHSINSKLEGIHTKCYDDTNELGNAVEIGHQNELEGGTNQQQKGCVPYIRGRTRTSPNHPRPRPRTPIKKRSSFVHEREGSGSITRMKSDLSFSMNDVMTSPSQTFCSFDNSVKVRGSKGSIAAATNRPKFVPPP
eukprot:CAMPEP_0172541702 /NCGR_PEP_ID=MMETSP1067-20121228/12469_1 /TAXON_ID=265564 ORGANISM="Thalassiosira punctigera, Strain Tpunct2005C2" /NCGR_SAMPLE_ID=MMETSP1067 /ASSEMBLY_ACC=CAM_ASM_000444 /LENGTH=464 /DNA_ID=CAMNT_0013327797 /DNA_START=288 /DNA_END=1678 /DNA_ORIENTATION=+